MKPLVIKISGHELDEPSLLTDFAQTVAGINQPVVIVHGGGKEITALQEKMGIHPHYIDGVRITDADSLSIVTMVLCGSVNKRLVRYLHAAGLAALGLSGIDLGLVRARKMPHLVMDMGYTGEVVSVQNAVLEGFLAMGIIPVIAPVCGGEDSAYNVNADHVAGAIAASLGAERLIFLSNVAGVLANNELLPSLSSAETQALINNGTIYGGMIPKVQTALHALEAGVQRAVITNLAGLKAHSGTVFTR